MVDCITDSLLCVVCHNLTRDACMQPINLNLVIPKRSFLHYARVSPVHTAVKFLPSLVVLVLMWLDYQGWCQHHLPCLFDCHAFCNMSDNCVVMLVNCLVFMVTLVHSTWPCCIATQSSSIKS